MHELRLERLAVRDFRNLTRIELAPAARLNVLWGANGHGKTSLLEAIYFVATTRSFRTHRLGELVRHGADVALVRASFSDEHARSDHPREQTAAIEGRRCVPRLDGNRPESLAAFATRSPVVAFHPEELELSTGAAVKRRTLLDRVALYLEPASAAHRSRYQHALKSRQHLLATRSPRSDEVDAFEALCARHGAALTRARARAFEALLPSLRESFASIAAPDLELEARYEPGGSPDEVASAEELVRRRDRDAHRPTAGFGPHRDELALFFGRHPARVVGSQGQHRALTLALKAAETRAIAAARGVEPILLLDDVSSELDPVRTEALFRFLATAHGQIFLTTTRPELVQSPDLTAQERRDFVVREGVVELAANASVGTSKSP